jgi:cation:H+ antiporter
MLDILLYTAIFLISCGSFYFSGQLVVKSLVRIAEALHWKEFVICFIVMAIVASLPNLFVGIFSALNHIPQLSFGDVVGGNVVDTTLAVALAALFSKKGIPAKSKTVQTTLSFTAVAALLPILLAWDGVISRADGVILILFYALYLVWLFSKKENFSKTCEDDKPKKIKTPAKPHHPVRNTFQFLGGIAVFLVAAEGIVTSAQFFAATFNWPIILIGLFIVGIGNCAPEIFFAITSARKNHTWLVLGDLMGAIIGPATFVLGIVALITPIEIKDFSPFAVARVFLILSIFFFFFFVRNDEKISKKEASFLLMLYIVFIIAEIFVK